MRVLELRRLRQQLVLPHGVVLVIICGDRFVFAPKGGELRRVCRIQRLHQFQHRACRSLRHFPVVRDGRLCGIISIGDVVKNRLDEVEYEASSLRSFIAGA